MKLRHLWILAIAGACGIVPLGHAAGPLRLEEAIARALASNPAVAAESAQLQAVQARAQRDSLPTPYVLGGDVDNIGGTGALSGVHAAETTLRVSRVIELGGKITARAGQHYQSAPTSEIGKRSSFAGASPASLPLTSLLSLVRLYRDIDDALQIAKIVVIDKSLCFKFFE